MAVAERRRQEGPPHVEIVVVGVKEAFCLACGQERKFSVRKRVFDDFFEFEVTVCKDEGAFGRSVQVLDAMASEMNPFAPGHLFENTFDRTGPILSFDNFDRICCSSVAYTIHLQLCFRQWCGMSTGVGALSDRENLWAGQIVGGWLEQGRDCWSV